MPMISFGVIPAAACGGAIGIGGRGIGGLMLAFTGCICPAILGTPYVQTKLDTHQILVSFSKIS
jgi:hypothetical protein